MNLEIIVPVLVAAFGAIAALLLLRQPSLAETGGTVEEIDGLPRAFVKLIRRAGYRPGREGWQLMLAVVLAAIAGAGAGWFATLSVIRSEAALVGLLSGACLGIWMPLAWIQGRAEDRSRLLQLEFPVMLDLLQLALSGGQSLGQAWKTVASTVAEGSPAMGSEMRLVDIELALGGSWKNTLESASDRTGCLEFTRLGGLLSQSERFGTDLAQALAAHADSIRNDQIQMFEERAHRASVRMLFPMILLLLPATLILMIGPMLFLLLEALAGVNAD